MCIKQIRLNEPIVGFDTLPGNPHSVARILEVKGQTITCLCEKSKKVITLLQNRLQNRSKIKFERNQFILLQEKQVSLGEKIIKIKDVKAAIEWVDGVNYEPAFEDAIMVSLENVIVPKVSENAQPVEA